MKRELTCIICPRGCALTAGISGSQVNVSGNACPKGKEYAVSECLNPMRTVTATVRVANREDTMVSVKTLRPVPKKNTMDVINLLRGIRIQAPVRIGETVVKDVFGTDIVITKSID